jgi:hypothetical protein
MRVRPLTTVVGVVALLTVAIAAPGSPAKAPKSKQPKCSKLFSKSDAESLSGGAEAILTSFAITPQDLWVAGRHVAWMGTQCTWTLTHAESDPNQETCGNYADAFAVGYGGTLSDWHHLESKDKKDPGAPFSGTPETQTRLNLGLGSKAFAETAADICQPPGSPPAHAMFALTKRHNAFYMSFYPATLDQMKQKARAILKATRGFL